MTNVPVKLKSVNINLLDIPPISQLIQLPQRWFTLLTSKPGTQPKPTQPWCKPSPHGDEIRCQFYIATGPVHYPVLPHITGTYFTPWYGKAVI